MGIYHVPEAKLICSSKGTMITTETVIGFYFLELAAISSYLPRPIQFLQGLYWCIEWRTLSLHH